MNQSDRSIVVEYFSIFHPNIPPLVLGMLIGCVATDTSSSSGSGMDTSSRVNIDGYFVILTY